ncbi:MAG: adenosine kinase [Actinobacteria bacterium]|nr:adenosine kinase [Actinomycetota bacterium]
MELTFGGANAGTAAAQREPAGPLDVVAIGNALLDVLVDVAPERIERAGLRIAEMALVDLERAEQLLEGLVPVSEVSGGSAANTAVGVAALGGQAGYLGKVARDAAGSTFIRDMRQAGVSFRGPAGPAEPASATGRCVVMVSPGGERTMATYIGAAGELGPDDLDRALLQRAKIVYLEGYLWDFPLARDAMRLAVDLAHANESLVALSVSDPSCVERHRSEFMALLSEDVDLLFANEAEATSLLGSGSLDDVARALDESGVVAAVTMGAGGSLVVAPEGTARVPAAPVATAVVDTTGAGDLYAAGFLFGLARGADPETSARIGSVCAAEVVTHYGARPVADLGALVADAGLMPASSR